MSENKKIENVNGLLDMIDRWLEEGSAIPFSSGRRIVDADRLHDCVDEVRRYLPGELREATAIVRDRAQILEQANENAANIIKKAEERARVLVSEEEIYRTAKKQAGEVVAHANNDAIATRNAVVEYCESMLKETEKALVGNLSALRETQKSLYAATNEDAYTDE